MSRRARILVAGAVVVVVVLAAELTARALEPYLPAPDLYGDEATATKVAQMDARGGTCVDVVVAGDSTARDGIDPSVFGEADPAHRSVYNASLDAGSPRTMRRWVTEEVLPRTHPATLVLPVASLDLNATGPAVANATRAYDEATLTRPDALGRVQAATANRSALVRLRTELRDPAALWSAVARLRDGQRVARPDAAGITGVVGPAGEGLSRRGLVYRPNPGTSQFTRQQLLRDFRVDPEQVAALGALVRDARAQGTDVVLAALPVTEDYVALHPGGRRDYDAYLAALHEVAASEGVALVDLHDRVPPPDAFADTHHLNATGARWLTAQLPGALADAGVAPTPCAA